MSNTNELGAIDPTELDGVLEVEIDPTDTDTDIIGDSGDEDIDIDTDEDDELFKDDEEDSDDDGDDEVPVKVKKTPAPKKEKKTRIDMDAPIKRVPQIGQKFKAKYFTIEIIGKSGTVSLCKVLASQPPCKLVVGETFEAGEIAFYSEYYQIVGY
jgi:hypothetical protein